MDFFHFLYAQAARKATARGIDRKIGTWYTGPRISSLSNRLGNLAKNFSGIGCIRNGYKILNWNESKIILIHGSLKEEMDQLCERIRTKQRYPLIFS